MFGRYRQQIIQPYKIPHFDQKQYFIFLDVPECIALNRLCEGDT